MNTKNKPQLIASPPVYQTGPPQRKRKSTPIKALIVSSIVLGSLVALAIIGGIVFLIVNFTTNNANGKVTADDFNSTIGSVLQAAPGVTSKSSASCTLYTVETYKYELNAVIETTATTREELIEIGARTFGTIQQTVGKANSGKPSGCNQGRFSITSSDQQIRISFTFYDTLSDTEIMSELEDWDNATIYSCMPGAECTLVCTGTSSCSAVIPKQ